MIRIAVTPAALEAIVATLSPAARLTSPVAQAALGKSMLSAAGPPHPAGAKNRPFDSALLNVPRDFP
jgi:hypothetical protein